MIAVWYWCENEGEWTSHYVNKAFGMVYLYSFLRGWREAIPTLSMEDTAWPWRVRRTYYIQTHNTGPTNYIYLLSSTTNVREIMTIADAIPSLFSPSPQVRNTFSKNGASDTIATVTSQTKTRTLTILMSPPFTHRENAAALIRRAGILSYASMAH